MLGTGKFDVVEDAKKHIAAMGSKGWRAVRNRHAGVSNSTFWRAVRAAKSELAAEEMRTVSELGIRTPRTHCDPWNASVTDVDYVTPLRVDYFEAYRQLFSDVSVLRQSALNADGSVRSLALIARSVRLMNQIYSLRSVRIFVDALIFEAELDSPNLRRRILARLEPLSSQGMVRPQPSWRATCMR
jgi:hypothetical protein